VVDVVRGAGTVIEAGVGKIADDIKTGRFVDNLTKMPGDTQALRMTGQDSLTSARTQR